MLTAQQKECEPQGHTLNVYATVNFFVFARLSRTRFMDARSILSETVTSTARLPPRLRSRRFLEPEPPKSLESNEFSLLGRRLAHSLIVKAERATCVEQSSTKHVAI